MRKFDTGATRDADESKFDYEGFLSPLVLERFGRYMHANRVQADGQLRDSDNWQKGIPQDQYMKSAWRHFMEWWTWHRGWGDPWLNFPDNVEGMEDAVCALLFNAMGYLHEHLKESAGAEPKGQPVDVQQGAVVGSNDSGKDRATAA